MIIPTGYAQANLIFTGSGLPTGAEITLGLKLDNPALTPFGVAGLVVTEWAANIQTVMNNTTNLSGCRVKFGPNDDGPWAEVTGSNPGGASNPGASPAVSLLAKKFTNRGGKANVGRMYIPGVAESWVDPGGNVLGSVVTAFNTGLAAFMSAMDGHDLPLYLLHNDNVHTPTAITFMSMETVAATQRRRQRRA